MKLEYNGKVLPVVDIEHYPDCDEIDFEEIDSTDISQGSGNVIIRYFYIPALDIICRYVDF